MKLPRFLDKIYCRFSGWHNYHDGSCPVFDWRRRLFREGTVKLPKGETRVITISGQFTVEEVKSLINFTIQEKKIADDKCYKIDIKPGQYREESFNLEKEKTMWCKNGD